MCGLLSRPAGRSTDPLKIVLPGVIASVPVARRRFWEFITALCLSEEQQAQVALLFGEAVTNAIQHGSPRAEADRIRIECCFEADTVRMAVADDGPGFDPLCVRVAADPASDLEASLMATSGRGIFLMRACGEVSYEFPAHGTICRLSYRLKSAETRENG